MVEGPLAGSPAEEAGILGGETLTEIGEKQANAPTRLTREQEAEMLTFLRRLPVAAGTRTAMPFMGRCLCAC